MLMAAAMLAWSVAPPPIQHRHDGGTDLSHHHDCDDAGYGRPDRSPQGYCASDVGKPHALIFAPEGIGGEASHLHFQWLGFRVTLPDGESPTTGTEAGRYQLVVGRGFSGPMEFLSPLRMHIMMKESVS